MVGITNGGAPDATGPDIVDILTSYDGEFVGEYVRPVHVGQLLGVASGAGPLVAR